jgi:hypothetical protein
MGKFFSRAGHTKDVYLSFKHLVVGPLVLSNLRRRCVLKRLGNSRAPLISIAASCVLQSLFAEYFLEFGGVLATRHPLLFQLEWIIELRCSCEVHLAAREHPAHSPAIHHRGVRLELV